MENAVRYDVRLPKEESVYEHDCPIIHALNAIGGKWKLPILWHMADQGVVRYNTLKRSVRGISNMMLSKSLREMEEAGLVQRTPCDAIPLRVEYSLTESGRGLMPALNSLYAWGEMFQRTQTSNRERP